MATLTSLASVAWGEACQTRSAPATGAPVTTTTPTSLGIDGTYAMRRSSMSGGCHPEDFPSGMTVAHGGTQIRITVTGSGVQQPFTGTVRGDQSFEATFDTSVGGTRVRGTISGQFGEVSDGIIVRGGVLRLVTTGSGLADTDCDFGFDARKSR
jgi:hypothetical protein